MSQFWILLDLKMMDVVVTTGAIRRQIFTTNKPTPGFLQAGCPSCHPTNNVKALKGKSITFHGLSYPKLTWGFPTLSLTSKGPCLLWGGLPSLLSTL